MREIDRRGHPDGAGLALARGLPALAGVRPHEHDARRRVPQVARRRATSRNLARRAARARHRRATSCVMKSNGGVVDHRAAAGEAGRPAGLRARRRRPERDLLRTADRSREPHLDGHGRHELRREPDRRRRGASRTTEFEIEWGLPVYTPDGRRARRSAPAAARWPGSTRAGCCASGRAAPGADPGPACYGRGGTRGRRSTDANVALGRINPGLLPAAGELRARRRRGTRGARAARRAARR